MNVRALILVLGMLVVLAACAGSPSSPPAAITPAPSDSTSVLARTAEPQLSSQAGAPTPSEDSRSIAAPTTAPVAEPTNAAAPTAQAETSPLKRRDLPPEGIDAQLAVAGFGAGGGRCTKKVDEELSVSLYDDTQEIGVSREICFVGFAPDEPIAARVIFPDGALYELEILSQSENQQYTDFFLFWEALPGDPLGQYTVMATQGDLQASATFNVVQASTPRIFTHGAINGSPGTAFVIGLAGFEPGREIPLRLYRWGTCSDAQQTTTCFIFMTTLPPARADARGEALYAMPSQPDDPENQYLVRTDDCGAYLCGVWLGIWRTSPATYSVPAWSPDGTRIASVEGVSGTLRLYAVGVDGSNAISLVESLGSYTGPAWSPDGTRLAFTSKDDIFTINADGSDMVNLTNDPALSSKPVWSPDGRQIAFFSSQYPVSAIYLVNADGSNLRRLTNDASIPQQQLAWSHDGRRLAYQVGGDIYIIDIASGQSAKLTHSSLSSAPTWSPDDKQIMFLLGKAGHDIWLVDADGSNLHNLTNNPADDTDPAWSPDGARIAFASGRDTNYEIYVVNVDGSGLTRLTNDDMTDDTDPAWSPDGRRIAFISGMWNHQQIYIMSADGTGRVRLTSN